MAKRARSTGSGIKNIETTKLLAELDRRRAVLTAERAELMVLVEEIDEHLAALGEDRKSSTKRATRTAKKRRRTRSGGGSLADTLHAALKGKQLSVTEATDAARASGYKTKSSAKNFRVMVNQTLTKDTRFKRVSRGVYTAKQPLPPHIEESQDGQTRFWWPDHLKHYEIVEPHMSNILQVACMALRAGQQGRYVPPDSEARWC